MDFREKTLLFVMLHYTAMLSHLRGWIGFILYLGFILSGIIFIFLNIKREEQNESKNTGDI